MGTPLQHRIYLGRPHTGADCADLERAGWHWRHRHSRVVRDMPLLNGYVQNRPLEEWWGRMPFLVCAETWFASREDEHASYASDYYRDVIAVDERNVIPPEGAWNSSVERIEELRPGERAAFRVLGFGQELPGEVGDAFTRVELLHVRRPTPDGAPHVFSAWTDDRDAAVALARGLDGLAFACEAAAIVVPDVDGWERRASDDGSPLDPESGA